MVSYSSWLQQDLAEPAKPRTEEHPTHDANSIDCLNDLVTQFIGMATHSNEEMADIPRDWEHEGEEPIIDLDKID